MRIGIYTNSPIPEYGGAFTLLETIIYDISSFNSEHTFIILFSDKLAPKKYEKDKLVYLNCYKKKYTFLYRIIRKIIKLFFNVNIDKSLDELFIDENIDLIWLLGPFNFDTSIPYIYTVWDLGHRMLPCFPEVSGKDWKSREQLYNKMLPQATYIITGNNTGKNEILSNYSVNPEKIHIIPFPIPSFCFLNKNRAILPQIQICFPFVFYPAQFWAHKNHVRLIEAIAWLRDEKKIIINCYFSGHNYGNLNYINDTIKKYNLSNQIFILGFIERDTLIFLYKNALAMVYLSLLGPNNLPPLEAAALGCPLIYSNIPGHIEQMEGTGLPVDVTNFIDIGEAILKVYSDPEFRNNLISKENKFVQKYKDYSYFEQMLKLLNSFYIYRKTWKD